MTETRLGFLYNAASMLLQIKNSQIQTLLRSYYLMRCSDVSTTAALPKQYFSPKLRCPHCYIEWQKGTETTVVELPTEVFPVDYSMGFFKKGVKRFLQGWQLTGVLPLVLQVSMAMLTAYHQLGDALEYNIRKRKLSKRQKRRLRQKALYKNDPKYKKELSYDKVSEQICTFCKHRTTTPLVKIDKDKASKTKSLSKENKSSSEKVANAVKSKTSKVHSLPVKKSQMNVYASAKDIFSLKNKDNNLTSSIQTPAKVIKNNKKKKDKFAGLCQQAVLASVKLKNEQNKLNKLNLFLKPSS